MSRDGSDVDRLVGAAVAAARAGRGFSQAAMAEAIGVTLHEIADLEQGIVRPTALMLMNIGALLGVDVRLFFSRDSAPQSANSPPTADEGLRLMRAFHGIQDRAVREQVIAHVTDLAQRD